MGEDEYDPPIILGRPFLSTIKVIIYIGTGEVHIHFLSEKVRCYFTDPNYIVEDPKQVSTRRRRCNRNQRSQIIKDGWADYEGEVVMSEDRQLEQNCPEETVAPRPCLVLKKFCKIFQILHHIESLDICMKY